MIPGSLTPNDYPAWIDREASQQTDEIHQEIEFRFGEGPPVADKEPTLADPVNHPPHYTGHPSGIECIQITEHMNFCIGNAVKYLWRADLKANAIQDLEKARWYIDREIQRRNAQSQR